MFFQRAQTGYNHWWRYIIVILVVLAGYVIGQTPLYLAIGRAVAENPDLGAGALEEFGRDPDFSMFDISSNMGFTLLLVMFLGAFAAFYFIFKPLHQREFRTLVTPSSRVDWPKIFFGFGFWLVLSLILEAVVYGFSPENYSFQFQWNTFIPLLLLSLFLLPVQTSTEEFFFRGYLMQGIGNSSILRKAGLNLKCIPLILTSLMFGFVHSMNPEVTEFGYGVMQIYYVSAGLVLGVMTLMDDSLELALGVHAATNFTGAVFVGYEGAAIRTDSLFLTQELDPVLMTLGFVIISLTFLLVCKYRFNWGSFGKLFSRVEAREEDLV
ncbi:MAG: type II CAAX prenyl endopeptidase Rce1 family protein [Saprospiraceae bacterium]